MKRAIGLFMCLLMVAGCLSVSQADVGECTTEGKEVIETKTEYLTDEQLAQLYSCKQDVRKKDDSIVELSQKDAWLLMQVGRSEGGSDLLGQLWTMRTILNRLDADWADSLWDVLTMEEQFEVVINGTYKDADVNADSHLALALIEGGWNDTEGALYWESSANSCNSWHKRNLHFIREISGNRFYR